MDLTIQRENIWTIRDGDKIIAAERSPEKISQKYSELIQTLNRFDRISDRREESVK